MAFGTQAIRADVEFVSSGTGAVRADMATIRADALRTYSSMSDETLKASIAQGKLDKALAGNAIESETVKRAIASYRAELASLEAQSLRTGAAVSRSSRSGLKSEEQSLGKVTRGVVSRSGVLGGRAAAFASTAFLGGVGATYAVQASLKAAENEQVALTKEQNALRNTGQSWTRYGGEIEDAVGKQEKATGFDKADVGTALAANITRFHDVGKAISVLATEEDVARQKGDDLSTVQTLVQRASFGTAKSVHALGIEYTASTANVDQLKETTEHYTPAQLAAAKAADQQANSTRILALIQAKYHGDAAKYLTTTAGKEQLFNAELKDTETTIGTALLPTFNHYLGSLTDWLGKAKNQKEIQDNVNTAVKTGATVIRRLGQAIGVAKTDLEPLAKLLGGFPNLIEAAFGAKLLYSLSKTELGAKAVAAAMTGIGTSAVAQATVAETALNTEASVAEADAVKIREAAATPLVGGSPGGGGFIPFSGAGGGPGVVGRVGQYTGATPAEEATPTPAAGGKLGPLSVVLMGSIPDVAAKAPKLQKGQAFIPGKFAVGDIYRDKNGGLWKIVSTGSEGHGLDYGFGVPYKIPSPHAALQTGSPAAAAGTPAAGTPASGYQPTGSAALDLALSNAQGSGNQSAIEAASKAKLAYDDKAKAFALNRIKNGKGTPSLVEQLKNINLDESSLRSTIDSIDSANASAAKTASDAAKAALVKKYSGLTKVPAKLSAHVSQLELHHATPKQIVAALKQEQDALKKQVAELKTDHAPEASVAAALKTEDGVKSKINAVLKKARSQRITALTKPPINLQLELASAKARGASEATILKILEQEHAALDAQVKTLQKIGASKEEILTARNHEATIEAQIAAAKKKVGTGGTSAQFAQLESEFLDTQSGILSDYAADLSTPGSTHVTVHQHFPVAPTGDGHREAIYARAAARAAFD